MGPMAAAFLLDYLDIRFQDNHIVELYQHTQIAIKEGIICLAGRDGDGGAVRRGIDSGGAVALLRGERAERMLRGAALHLL